MLVLGGICNDTDGLCLKYNFTHNKWRHITNMNIRRHGADCTVFEDKIVVSGGYNDISYKSVEVYDHQENKWNYLPDMIHSRVHHSSASLGNKLFVILGHYS